jgi:hypothetical protein
LAACSIAWTSDTLDTAVAEDAIECSLIPAPALSDETNAPNTSDTQGPDRLIFIYAAPNSLARSYWWCAWCASPQLEINSIVNLVVLKFVDIAKTLNQGRLVIRDFLIEIDAHTYFG